MALISRKYCTVGFLMKFRSVNDNSNRCYTVSLQTEHMKSLDFCNLYKRIEHKPA